MVWQRLKNSRQYYIYSILYKYIWLLIKFKMTKITGGRLSGALNTIYSACATQLQQLDPSHSLFSRFLSAPIRLTLGPAYATMICGWRSIALFGSVRSLTVEGDSGSSCFAISCCSGRPARIRIRYWLKRMSRSWAASIALEFPCICRQPCT